MARGKSFASTRVFSQWLGIVNAHRKGNQMGLVDHVETCAVNYHPLPPCCCSLYWWLCTLLLFLPD